MELRKSTVKVKKRVSGRANGRGMSEKGRKEVGVVCVGESGSACF